MEQTAPSPVKIGDILAQKYQVTRILAVGGMGVVVVANHLQLDQPVALKFMLPEALASPEAVQRFLREARAAVRLRSEHVARVIDVGTLEDGAPYIVMEYLDGKDLSQVIEARKTMPLGTAVDWVLQASHAIAEAHSLGIIHRDLKPSNLFLTKLFDGSDLVKVLDFGISKTTGGADLNMTKTTMVMGSPTYMSPEQMRSARHVDVRTDIWSLGVILYEMLAGRVPFDGENFSELVIKATLDPTPDLPAHLNIPREFEGALRKCLEKDPQKRYPNVADMAAAMAPWAPPSSRALVERIARMLRGESTGTSQVTTLPDGADSGPTRKVPSYAGEGPPPHVPGKPSTLSGVEAQAFPAKKGKAKLVVVLGAIALAALIGIVAATSGGGKGGGGTIEPARGGLIPQPPPPKDEPKQEPAKTEPVAADPRKTEPPNTEPAKTDPPKTEPAAVEPKTEPAKTEPAKTEPPPAEPPKTAPVATEPPKTEPPKTEPAKTEPPKAEPAKADPPKAEPAKSDTPKSPGKKAACPNPIMRNGKRVCI